MKGMASYITAFVVLASAARAQSSADGAVERRLAEVKRPQSAFFLWAAENREKIQKDLKTKDISAIGKKLGELWKVEKAAVKAKHEATAKAQKEKYAAWLKTAEGKAAFAEKQQERSDKKAKKGKKAAKAAKASVAMDDRLKRPMSAYFLWLNDNRQTITKSLPKGSSVAAVSSKAGEMWKGLAEKVKSPYEAKAKKAKDDYDAFVASAKGAAVLKAYKDKVSEAKGDAKAAKSEVKAMKEKKATTVKVKVKSNVKAAAAALLFEDSSGAIRVPAIMLACFFAGAAMSFITSSIRRGDSSYGKEQVFLQTDVYQAV
jgi:hypothetical protein